MKETDWRITYAPRGYTWRRHRIEFVKLESSDIPDTIQEMKDSLKQVAVMYNEADTFTRITVYPKAIGESLNHLDPLCPRFGIEIEIRIPAPSGVRYADSPPSNPLGVQSWIHHHPKEEEPMNGPYAEFTIRQSGPTEYPALSIELDSTFSERFLGLLKCNLSHGSERAWDGERVRWFISPNALDRAIEIATVCFRKVYKVEGGKITDCITGTVTENLNLF